MRHRHATSRHIVALALLIAATFGSASSARAEVYVFSAAPPPLVCNLQNNGHAIDRAHAFHSATIECTARLNSALLETRLFADDDLAETYTGSYDGDSCHAFDLSAPDYNPQCGVSGIRPLSVADEYRPAGGLKCGTRYRIETHAVMWVSAGGSQAPDPWATLYPNCSALEWARTRGQKLDCYFNRVFLAC